MALVGALLCVAAWLAAGIHFFWNNPRLINFLAAWIPFVLTVLLAFVPDYSMRPVKKLLWRSGVISVGFAWSVVLWHQQVITEVAAQNSEQRIVRDANGHADEKFAQVENDLSCARTDLGSRIDKVPTETQLSKTETDITNSINKISLPATKYAKIQFTLIPESGESMPLMSQYLHFDQEGNITFRFEATNSSDVPAKSLELWVNICQGCSYPQQPAGFEKSGLNDHMRHRAWGLLNIGVSTDVMTVKVTPPNAAPFKVGFAYSCETCDRLDDKQVATITPLAGP